MVFTAKVGGLFIAIDYNDSDTLQYKKPAFFGTILAVGKDGSITFHTSGTVYDGSDYDYIAKGTKIVASYDRLTGKRHLLTPLAGVRQEKNLYLCDGILFTLYNAQPGELLSLDQLYSPSNCI